MQPILRIAAALVVPASAWAGSFSVFVGPPGGTGCVRVFDESGVALPFDLPDLADVRLLALDFSARAALLQLSNCQPRLRDDVPGANRLSLPQGRGALYHYVRAEGTAAEAFGFFVVDATRIARIVLELPSATSGIDPFVERVAVAPDGDGVLIATVRAAGGDLFEVDLSSPRVLLHTANLAPLEFRGRGLALQAAFGAAVHKDGILRFDRGVDTDAQPVGFAPGEYPVWFERAVVASCNGAWIATVAGEGPQITYPYVFGATGIAQRMTNLAADLSGAGLAPDAENGPWLAVSDDGCSCAWRIRPWGPWDDAELYLGTRAGPSLPGTAEHVTRDELFAPYLDETGVFVFTPGGKLLFVAGDPPDAGVNAFRSADVFSAERTASGALELHNLTGTSGDAVPPFDSYGTLVLDRLVWLASAEAYLALAAGANDERLFAVSSQTNGPRELAAHVNRLDLLELAPQHLVLSVLAPAGSNRRGLLRVPLDLSTDPELVLPLAPGIRGTRGSLGAGGQCALVATDGTSDSLWHVDVATAIVTPFAQHALDVGPLVDLTRYGVVLATFDGSAGTPAVTSWDPVQQPVRHQTLANGGFVLGGP